MITFLVTAKATAGRFPVAHEYTQRGMAEDIACDLLDLGHDCVHVQAVFPDGHTMDVSPFTCPNHKDAAANAEP